MPASLGSSAGVFCSSTTIPLSAGTSPGLRRNSRRFPAEITLSELPMERGTLVTAAIRDASERLAAQAERERLAAG